MRLMAVKFVIQEESESYHKKEMGIEALRSWLEGLTSKPDKSVLISSKYSANGPIMEAEYGKTVRI